MLVQFGNNWIQKIPRTAKYDTGPTASSNFGCPQSFSHPIISKLDSMKSYYIYKLKKGRLFNFSSLDPLSRLRENSATCLVLPQTTVRESLPALLEKQ